MKRLVVKVGTYATLFSLLDIILHGDDFVAIPTWYHPHKYYELYRFPHLNVSVVTYALRI